MLCLQDSKIFGCKIWKIWLVPSSHLISSFQMKLIWDKMIIFGKSTDDSKNVAIFIILLAVYKKGSGYSLFDHVLIVKKNTECYVYKILRYIDARFEGYD